MKYKLLLTGTNQVLINDFFYHMHFSFECMCSSMRTDDALCHLRYYQPDALVFCLYNERKMDINGFFEVKHRLSALKIPFIIIGEEADCETFEKTLPMAADLTIKKPITTKGLEEKILAYLGQHVAERKKEREEKDRLAQEEWAAKTEEAISEAKAEADGNNNEQSALESIAAQAAGQAEEKKHILIVDDDSNVLKLVKGYLREEYNVATAISGKIALRFLEHKKTDLILLDYEMPEESGAQVLAKIRSNENTKKLPVVFLTGVTQRERIQEVLELKPQGYLLKPIDTERLSATLKNVFKA